MDRNLAFKNGRVKGLLEEFKQAQITPEALEVKFMELRSRYDAYEGDDFSLEEWRTLLAYEMWKDGMEWTDVLDIWAGRNASYKERGDILVCLGHTFGYTKGDCEEEDTEEDE